jgi:putative lipoprotein
MSQRLSMVGAGAHITRIRFASVLTLALAACGGTPGEHKTDAQPADQAQSSPISAAATPMATGTVSGVAAYRERMALPGDAVFEAVLVDTSRADSSIEAIGSARVDPAGQPPIRFRIDYDAAQIEPGHTYAVRARVTRADQLLFTTDRHYALPAPGQELNLQLVRAQSSPTSGSSASPTLENTYWKLTRLGADAVAIGAENREPHLVLQSENQRVAGYGGCNRLMGSYSLAGERLSFSQMAGTMMACPEGMHYESAFHDALRKAASWKIEGERLELFDGTGVSVAQFESRYMR